MFKRLATLFLAAFAVSACTGDKAATAAAPANSATAAATSAPAAAPARDWQLGADYFLIDPRVPTTTGDKVEVAEVFSYACPHCAHFQPVMERLKAQLPANAQIVLVPAVFNPQWEPFARAFYTARSLGLLDKTHAALFEALHTQHQPLYSIESLAGFYANYGADPKSFLATANSFVTDSKIANGNDLVKNYGVTSTPTLVVNGKYRVEMSAERHIGPNEALDIALMLVKQESAK
ncbi:MAG: thiol:disulfide interchange protein DsbA/DsbL [Rudaea sp.]|uniref:thiol:disulfide interchange protein DsbA/DsbL n=1 Tax=Rudaea sp. TaxID=2136325 RepID=UPI0039E3D3CC